MQGYELTDFEWVIAPLLPNKPRGVPRVDDRRGTERDLLGVADGRAVAGAAEGVRPATTCCNRFVRWRKAGAWDRLKAAASQAYVLAMLKLAAIHLWLRHNESVT